MIQTSFHLLSNSFSSHFAFSDLIISDLFFLFSDSLADIARPSRRCPGNGFVGGRPRDVTVPFFAATTQSILSAVAIGNGMDEIPGGCVPTGSLVGENKIEYTVRNFNADSHIHKCKRKTNEYTWQVPTGQ